MRGMTTTQTLAMLLALGMFGPVVAQEALPGRTVESLLDYAKLHNLDYGAMRLEADAASERVYSAGAFPDPVFRTELQDVTNAGAASGTGLNLLPNRVGSTKYTLMQSLPFWGKRNLKREAAEAEAQAAQGSAGLTWTEQATYIKTTYAQYFAVTRLIRLSQEIIDLIPIPQSSDLNTPWPIFGCISS